MVFPAVKAKKGSTIRAILKLVNIIQGVAKCTIFKDIIDQN